MNCSGGVKNNKRSTYERLRTAFGRIHGWGEKALCHSRLPAKGLSINDEIDWPRMAKFHAEWSKKLYDAIVKYIVDMA